MAARRGIVCFTLLALMGTGCSQSVPVNNHNLNAVDMPAGGASLRLEGSPEINAIAGSPYGFRPTLIPSGAAAKFDIANGPYWALFNMGTGSLSGTPSSSDVGTTSNIVITAKLGTRSATLGPFSITVAEPGAAAPPGTRSATLTWVTPVVNGDVTSPTHPAGYRIYYGTRRDALSQIKQIDGPASTTCVVDRLVSGTYYFAITAYNSSGAESARSNVVSKDL